MHKRFKKCINPVKSRVPAIGVMKKGRKKMTIDREKTKDFFIKKFREMAAKLTSQEVLRAVANSSGNCIEEGSETDFSCDDLPPVQDLFEKNYTDVILVFLDLDENTQLEIIDNYLSCSCV